MIYGKVRSYEKLIFLDRNFGYVCRTCLPRSVIPVDNKRERIETAAETKFKIDIHAAYNVFSRTIQIWNEYYSNHTCSEICLDRYIWWCNRSEDWELIWNSSRDISVLLYYIRVQLMCASEETDYTAVNNPRTWKRN